MEGIYYTWNDKNNTEMMYKITKIWCRSARTMEIVMILMRVRTVRVMRSPDDNYGLQILAYKFYNPHKIEVKNINITTLLKYIIVQ